MNKDNFLHIPASLRDSFVYRIVPVRRLFELFALKQNVLVKPKRWEDPFENFILNCRVQLANGASASFDFQDQFYGQCWTLQSASDAIWRIYSPKANAIRIRSTIRRLADGLWQRCGKSASRSAFIGRVQYLTEPKLESFARGVFRSPEAPTSAKLCATTLLVKRPAFRHESEVRLIFTPNNAKKVDSDFFYYPVDPNQLIDQIMIDPRMAMKAATALKQRIKSETGFAGSVKRSLLYAPPPRWIIPL
jgi:hypothetical protein